MFKFKFVAIRRIDRANRMIKLVVTANTEREARRQFASNYILFFVARIRTGGRHDM